MDRSGLVSPTSQSNGANSYQPLKINHEAQDFAVDPIRNMSFENINVKTHNSSFKPKYLPPASRKNNLEVAKARNRYTNLSGNTVKDSTRQSAREDRGRNGSITQMMHHSNSNIE